MKRILFALLFLGITPMAIAGEVDNTTCTVLTGDDHSDNPGFHELRRKVQEGFNRNGSYDIRMCTEKIQFGSGDIKVELNAPLDINNDADLDCTPGAGKPEVCGDGWGLIVDGNGGSIDVTKVAAGECAISLNASRVKMLNLKITATSAQVEGHKVICDNGNHNDLSGVEINGETTNPTPTPKPTPPASPTPSPTASPLVTPGTLTAVVDPSSTSTSLKVLLSWSYNPGKKGGGFIHIDPSILSKLKTPLVLSRYQFKAMKAGPAVSAIDPGSITLDPGTVFTPTIPDKDYDFEIERATKAASTDPCGTFSPIATINGKDTTYQDATVAEKTSYCYRVRAVRGSDHSEYSNVAEIRTPELALPIPSLTATGVSETSIFVSYSYENMDGVFGIKVERGNASCEVSSFTAIPADPAGTSGVGSTTDTGLTANTTYCYRAAVASDVMPPEYGLYSETVTATTLEPGATPVPTPSATPHPTPTATPHPTATPSATATPDPTDPDGDGVPTGTDNCPAVKNADQHDLDGDHIGDVCDPDADGDGISNTDEAAHGTDPLDSDSDDDGAQDDSDNCPTVANADQADKNDDGRGDACSGGSGNPSGNLPPGAAIGGGGGLCSLSLLAAPSTAPWVYLGGFSLLLGLNRSFRSRRKK